MLGLRDISTPEGSCGTQDLELVEMSNKRYLLATHNH